MGDETDNSGGGALAWYQIGRWAAEDDREQAEFLARLKRTAPVPVDDHNRAVQVAKEWRAECLRLREVVAQLQAENARLEDLANRGLAARDKWKAKYEHQFDQTVMTSHRANRFQDELERLKGNA